MTPDVLYQDNHLLVIAKPAGLLSQADRTGDIDVVSWAKAYLKEACSKPGNVFVGLVHRLDRPASGAMVLARTSKAAGRLTTAFSQRDVEKVYLALVEGAPPQRGAADDYLAKVRQQVRVVRKTHPKAKEARLSWEMLGALDGRSLLTIKLDTGRAHQIRVQMASRGWPLVGDLRYGAKSEFDGRNLALHAHSLGLTHPTRREPQKWIAPLPTTWPEWCRDLIREA